VALLRDHFVFRPPDTTLRSNLTAGRYIHVLQSRDTYEQLASEMIPGSCVHLVPTYNRYDPLISQLVSTIANEMEGGFLDHILADALNTALAVQVTRLCGDPTRLTLEPSHGLSHERLKRVYEYIEANLDRRLTLTDLARVACLSPYHFSRSRQADGRGRTAALRNAPAGRTSKNSDAPNRSPAGYDRTRGRLRRPEPSDLGLSPRDRRYAGSLSRCADLNRRGEAHHGIRS
jgi:hypothetical protein